MSKHTPGPWFVNWAGSGKDGKFVYDECYVYAPETGVENVAVAADIADPLTGKPSAANARLIAAAPELLDALRAIVETDFLPGAWNDQYEAIAKKARAAIAQATGEPS